MSLLRFPFERKWGKKTIDWLAHGQQKMSALHQQLFLIIFFFFYGNINNDNIDNVRRTCESNCWHAILVYKTYVLRHDLLQSTRKEPKKKNTTNRRRWEAKDNDKPFCFCSGLKFRTFFFHSGNSTRNNACDMPSMHRKATWANPHVNVSFVLTRHTTHCCYHQLWHTNLAVEGI